jgi:thioesterase domain-containing protein
VGHFDHLIRLYEVNVFAMEKYEPGRYPGDIVLVRGTRPSELNFPESEKDHYGWRPYVGGEIKLRWVEGASHFNLMEEPYLKAVVAHLRELLPHD